MIDTSVMFLQIILVSVLLILLLVYFGGIYNESYWKRRGVKYYGKNRFLGPLWSFVASDRALFETFYDIYKEFRGEPAVGVGGMFTPALYVLDPKNTEHVMHLDFQSFHHRGPQINEDDILANNVLLMSGWKWRLMRQNMTPLFTSAKLRNMYYIMDKAAQDFVQHLKENPKLLKGDAYKTLTHFCNAAISAAVFGIGTKSTFESPFLDMTRTAFEFNLQRDLKFALSSSAGSIFKYLNLKLFTEFEDFFIGSIKQVLRQREKENVKKHDFADICIDLQKHGSLKDSETGKVLETTDENLAAQAFFFFVAGVEPCATAMFCTFIELGKHPEIQQKVQQEIDAAYAQNEGKLSYDVVYNLEYLDKVLSEALRMYPPIGFLSRKCTKDTVLPVGNIKVKKDTQIFVPVYAYHHDEQYFANPELFEPERFSSAVDDNVYMPFGKGGRVCIGMRYARLQVKAGLVHVLRHFSVNTLSQGKIQYVKQAVQVRLQNVDLEFVPRNL